MQQFFGSVGENRKINFKKGEPEQGLSYLTKNESGFLKKQKQQHDEPLTYKFCARDFIRKFMDLFYFQGYWIRNLQNARLSQGFYLIWFNKNDQIMDTDSFSRNYQWLWQRMINMNILELDVDDQIYFARKTLLLSIKNSILLHNQINHVNQLQNLIQGIEQLFLQYFNFRQALQNELQYNELLLEFQLPQQIQNGQLVQPQLQEWFQEWLPEWLPEWLHRQWTSNQ